MIVALGRAGVLIGLASAMWGALSMVLAARRKSAVVLPATLNPRYRRVVDTMMKGEDITVLEAPVGPAGTTDVEALKGLVTDDVAAMVIANPNYLGQIEPVDGDAAAVGGEKAGQHRGVARGGPRAGTEGALPHRSPGRQPVDIGGSVPVIPIAAQMIGPQGIDGDEDTIGAGA